MRSVFVIAVNTFREIIRDRILYGLVAFAVLMIGLSLALGQLSFAEQSRIAANFGMTAIHISCVILAIFVGSSLVAKEIDRKTILTLLVRPVSRTQFLLGKWFGLALLLSVVVLGLAAIMLVVFIGLGMSYNTTFLLGLVGSFLEALVLLSLTIFLSTFARPVLVGCFSSSFFLIGHWVENLNFFAQKSESTFFKSFVFIVDRVFPNLEVFNWRSLYIYERTIPMYEIFGVFSYAVVWIILFLLAAVLVVGKKDFA